MAHPATLVAFCALALSWPQPCQSPGTRETGSRIAPRENAPAQPRSPPSSAAQTSPCSSTTDTPRTVPKEIRADLLLEEKRVMRGNKAVVENDTVSKINLLLEEKRVMRGNKAVV